MSQQVRDQIEKSLKFLYENVDSAKVKEKVDQTGMIPYITYCAGLAAGSGAVAGVGGGFTMMVGLPVDIANTITQQFKVTLGVIYHKTGRHEVSFEAFMKIVGFALGIDVGTRGVEHLTVKVAQEIAMKLVARRVGRLIPLVGSVVGGGLNYKFVKSTGNNLLLLKGAQFEVG